MTDKCGQGNWELFALVGELHGSGIVLGWLLIQYIPKSKPPVNPKAVILQQFLCHFNKWGLKALTTLSDKDRSEITMMKAVFSEAASALLLACSSGREKASINITKAASFL